MSSLALRRRRECLSLFASGVSRLEDCYNSLLNLFEAGKISVSAKVADEALENDTQAVTGGAGLLEAQDTAESETSIELECETGEGAA